MKDTRGNNNLLSVIMERWPFSGKADEITFQSSGLLTLGTEIELQLIDPQLFEGRGVTRGERLRSARQTEKSDDYRAASLL